MATSPTADRLSLGSLLTLAAAFGLLAGLVEGAALFFLQKGPLAGETINLFFVPMRILYVSPLVDWALFVAVALATAGVVRLFRATPPDLPILFMVIFLLGFDWLSLLLDRVFDPIAILMLSAGISAAVVRTFRGRVPQLVRVARQCLPVMSVAVVVLVLGVYPRQGRREAKAAGELGPADRGAPNVLILVMDTVRADHLSAQGYSRKTTPNLDRLSSRSVLFENALSTSSWTLPAHASLLTGRLPFEHGAERLEYDGRYFSLAEEFQRRGYRTCAFSANTFFFTPQNGFQRGFIHFDGLFSSFADILGRPFFGRQLVTFYAEESLSDLPGRKSAEQVNQEFLAWLGRDGARPFFAVLNYFDAHAPYLPPAPFRSRFSSRPDPGGILNYVAGRETLNGPEQTRDEMDAYDGAIAFEDDQIGRLLSFLGHRNVADNTIVVIVSDHGEFFGEHGLFLHRNALFLPGIRVPLLLSWPGHVPEGIRVTRPVSIASVPATLMELLPLPGQADFPGPSLIAQWKEHAVDAPSPPILSELVSLHSGPSGSPPPRTESLVNTRWHLIATSGEAPQLYDWRADPGEQHNLAGSVEGQRVVPALLGCLKHRRSLIRRADCGLAAPQLAESRESSSSSEPGGAQ